MSDTQNPGMLARLIANNQITADEGERLIVTMLHDAARQAATPRPHHWIGNTAYVTASGRVYIGIGEANDVERAAEHIYNILALNYEGDDQAPKLDHVRAALVDALAQVCEDAIGTHAKARPEILDSDGRYGVPRLDGDRFITMIDELAETKARCDREQREALQALKPAV